MGCDGGSIPKRKELVKQKKKKEKIDPEIEYINKWAYCCVSDYPLRKPIVATAMGDLMNKEGAIEFLIKHKKDGAMETYHRIEDVPGLQKFHSMKGVKELNLKDIDKSGTEATSSTSGAGGEIRWARFCCPITNLDMNGHHKFLFSWKCGCVVSERAFKEIGNEQKCLVCQKPYCEEDIVVLNPDKKEFKQNEIRFMCRKLLEIAEQTGMAKPRHRASSSRDDDDSRPSTSASCSGVSCTSQSSGKRPGNQNESPPKRGKTNESR